MVLPTSTEWVERSSHCNASGDSGQPRVLAHAVAPGRGGEIRDSFKRAAGPVDLRLPVEENGPLMATFEGIRMTGDPAPLADKSPQASRRRCFATLWLLAIGLVFVVLVPFFMTEVVWIGHFPLTLDVRSGSGKAITLSTGI